MSVGTGRYTKYVPQSETGNYTRTNSLFNAQSEKGAIYTGQDLAAVAQNVRGVYAAEAAKNDVELWPTGNPRTTGPNLAEVSWKKSGDPANPYMPDLRSPGAGNSSLPASAPPEGLTVVTNAKKNIIPGADGTASPSANVIASPITGEGAVLVKGSSTKKPTT